MRWVQVGTTDLLECEGCDATWVEAATFEQLCQDRESQSAVLHTSTAGAPVTGPGRVQYRRCPRCEKMMNRINFGRSSGAIVDVCKGHGTFLDRGELHQVVRFIQEGGIDRARASERERLLEEQRRLRDLQRDQARLARSSETSRWDDRSLSELLGTLFGK